MPSSTLQPPPPPQPDSPFPVVHVVHRPPGFGRLVLGTITGAAMFMVILLLGVAIGGAMIGVAGVWLGGADPDRAVIWHTYRDGGAAQVAIIPVRGVIDAQRAAFVRGCVDDVIATRAVKAVVLRVNSPGGGVTASDEIWYEIDRLKKTGLPVVASFGGIAASGGYYVATGADEIVAQETTITGSIGVIAQVMTFEGLLDKVGVEPVTLVSRRSPDKSVANDIFRDWTTADQTQVLDILDAAYDTFHARVQAGRSAVITDEAQLDDLADGSVFTAAEAQAAGLVDGLGYLDDAIARAEQRATLAPGTSTVRMLGERLSLFDAVPRLGRRGDGATDAERIRSLVNDLGSVRLMYMMR